MKWLAQAPANIALIKYMGKADAQRNIPANASLSYTLGKQLSFVELESISGQHDHWETLAMPGAHPFELPKKAQARFLAHLAFLKQSFAIEQSFIVRSCNNFAMSAGLASSASSFAALTKAAVLAFSELQQKPAISMQEAAALSRQGSGSSCRSFFAPWVLWRGESLQTVDCYYTDLLHHVIMVDASEKAVSSSQAHQRIVTSPLFKDRHLQTEKRIQTLQHALNNQHWETAKTIVWDEFMEMHRLFESCDEPFHYISAKTKSVLDELTQYWQTYQDGPLITMDAGPNVHLLFRPDQQAMANEMKQHFLSDYDVL